jgi:hypothetical protein
VSADSLAVYLNDHLAGAQYDQVEQVRLTAARAALGGG